ncbi:MAG: tetratricopeptide repeat protein [Firmicutes bacterium]|nr:tetratricopeptide repeat protein [Bacillota bacterium]
MTDWDDEGQDLLQRGTEAWERRDRATAEALFSQLVQLFPDRPEGYNKLGVISAESGELKTAEEYFLRALSVDRRYAPALTNLGNIYLERGEVDQAIQHYYLALNSDPDYAPAHRNLSVAYRKQGKYAAFVSHFKRSQRLDVRRAHQEFRDQTRQTATGPLGRAATFPAWVWWVTAGIGVAILLTVFKR